MRSSDAHKLRLLERVNPLTREDVIGWADREQGRKLFAEVLQSTPPPTLQENSWAKRRKRIAYAGFLTSILLITFVSIWILRSAEETPPAMMDSAILESIARTASEQSLPAASATGYRYTKVKQVQAQLTVGDSPYRVLVSGVRESWIGPDGSGRTSLEPQEIEFPSPRDRAAWEASGKPNLNARTVEDRTYGPGELSHENYASLPSDPDQLFSEIEERAGTAGPGLHPEMFIVIGDLLRGTNVPPELRATLFRAAARIPGIKVVEDVKDAEGRSGVAMSLTYDDHNGSLVKVERIFDKESTVLLSEKETVIQQVAMPPQFRSPPPGAPRSSHPALEPPTPTPGTVVSSTVYLSSGIVASVRERGDKPLP
ncbi:MAG: CU044_5270 family protein [Actinomycetota bacterium]